MRPINGGRKERKKAVAAREGKPDQKNVEIFYRNVNFYAQNLRSDALVTSPKHARIFFIIEISSWLGFGGGGRWGDDNQEYKITAAALISYSVVGSPQIRLSCCSVHAGAGREMS